MKILLSSGGTGGTIAPLIAIAEEFQKRGLNLDILMVGTNDGPGRTLSESANIPFKAIITAKLRRYFDWRNFFIPFMLLIGLFKAFFILKKFQPDVIISGGSFASVPLVWCGKVLGVKSLIHQQDIIPGLANKLMAPFADIITVSFEESKKFFDARKTLYTGNPVRRAVFIGSREQAAGEFDFELNLATILITGGGTGASGLNNLTIQSLPELLDICQIIHLTGTKKGIDVVSLNLSPERQKRYRQYEFLTDKMSLALVMADLVVSRAGLAILTELSVLGKPTILVPMPNSHQEDNALLYYRQNAVAVLDQTETTPQIFTEKIKKILFSQTELQTLSLNIHKMMPTDAAEKIVNILING